MLATTTLVTLTYGDRLHYLTTLIERSLACAEIAQVIVVNNAASADLGQLLRRWPVQVQIIDLPSNTGSANGYAVGINAALQAGAEYIWLMDDDNAPTPGAIELLHQRLAECSRKLGRAQVAVQGFRPTHQADIAAGVPRRFAFPHRSSCFGFHIAQLPYKLWRRLPWGKPHADSLHHSLVKLPFATYGGLLGHRAMYENIGLPRTDMILYADDTEYTRRITASGGHIFLVTDAQLEDLEHSWNIKARTGNIYEAFLLGDSDLRAYYTARNQAWFDKFVWARWGWMYSLNRAVFMTLLHLVAWRRGTHARFALLQQAIADGEAGRLGLNKLFPL